MVKKLVCEALDGIVFTVGFAEKLLHVSSLNNLAVVFLLVGQVINE